MDRLDLEKLRALEKMNQGRPDVERSFKRREPFTDVALLRIKQGALDSDETPKGIKRELRTRIDNGRC